MLPLKQTSPSTPDTTLDTALDAAPVTLPTRVFSSAFNRRTVLGGLAGTAGLMTAAVAMPSFAWADSPSSHPSKPSPSSSGSCPGTPVATTPQASSMLADMVGVTAVTSTKDGVWGQDDLVLSRLRELGVRHVRTGIFKGNTGQVTRMQHLAQAAGIRFNTIMGDPLMANATPEELVTMVGTDLNGIVETMEGANEWNLAGRSNWANELRAHQQRLYAAAKASSGTSGIPVIAPALGNREGYDRLGDISSWCDLGNIHLYQGGFPPGFRSPEIMGYAQENTGTKPIFVTETGWQNATKSDSSHRWTSEQAAGIYAPRVFLDYFQRGVPRVFLHELIDEPDDVSMTNFEAHFGLLRGDFSRKPVFIALRNFLNLLDPPSATPAAARASKQQAASRPAPHSFVTECDDMRSVTVARRDGSWVVFLWRDVSVWDANGKQAVTPATMPISLSYRDKADVSIARPSRSRKVDALASKTSGTDLDLGGEVVALQVRFR